MLRLVLKKKPIFRWFHHPLRKPLAPATIGLVRWNSLLHNLFPTCVSCGVRLQNEDEDKPGFYRPPQLKPKLIKHEDEVFNRHLQELDQDDKKLLLGGSTEPYFAQSDKIVKSPQDLTKILCVRCRSALYRSEFSWDQHPVESLDKVMTDLPPDANLVYIVNGADFPFSLDSRLFRYRNPKDIKFLITKTDLLFPTSALSNKYGTVFFRDYLSRKHGANPANVFVTSGITDWNMDSILENLADNSYIVGSVNSGKSSIIKSLLYAEEGRKSKYTNSRDKTRIQKEQDRLINSGQLNNQLTTKLQRKSRQKFKQLHGPGSSYMPGFTRGHIVHQIGQKTVVDVPGFTSDENHGVYRYLTPDSIKTLSKGCPVHKKGKYDSHYDTVKGGQVLTVGGLFFLSAPPDTLYQVRNCINHKFHIFKNMDKALELWHHLDNNPSLQTTFVVDKLAAANLQKWLIPPFYGGIDLVVKNIGHINITPTGKKASNQPFIIYLPQGVQALIRQPITHYIAKTLAGRDAKGNKLRKENWKSKSVTSLKRYTGSTPFYSHLIPCHSQDYNHTISTTISQFRRENVVYNELSVVDESNKFNYWLYN